MREFAAHVDRVLADPGTDPAVLDRLLDDATTVANALDNETTRLHRLIDRAVASEINGLTRDLRDCYRDLELLRPRVRRLNVRREELRNV